MFIIALSVNKLRLCRFCCFLPRKSYIVDDWKTHIGTKQNGLTLIAHELAHQWFGNMMTTYWWSYIWLNEGFASFFQYLISDKVKFFFSTE